MKRRSFLAGLAISAAFLVAGLKPNLETHIRQRWEKSKGIYTVIQGSREFVLEMSSIQARDGYRLVEEDYVEVEALGSSFAYGSRIPKDEFVLDFVDPSKMVVSSLGT